LADGGDGKDSARIALARFAAENLISETAALKDRAMNGAESLVAARQALA
jgi:acyl-CoA dehydrogenase